VVVEEERVQAFAQGIIRGEFNRQQVLAGCDLVVVYLQVPDDGNIVPEGNIGLKVQVAFEPLFLAPYVGGKLYILEPVTKANGIFLAVYFSKQVVIETKRRSTNSSFQNQRG